MTGDPVDPKTMTYGHLTDHQMADKVRMLMRDTLEHEAVCCGARDRIMFLHQQQVWLMNTVASLTSVLNAARNMLEEDGQAEIDRLMRDPPSGPGEVPSDDTKRMDWLDRQAAQGVAHISIGIELEGGVFLEFADFGDQVMTSYRECNTIREAIGKAMIAPLSLEKITKDVPK